MGQIAAHKTDSPPVHLHAGSAVQAISSSQNKDITSVGPSAPASNTSQNVAQTVQHDKSAVPRTPKVIRAPHWRRASQNWAVRFDHNHLRMTRIIRSLRILGLHDEATAFYDALVEVYREPYIHINERTARYWHMAVAQPLHIAPDGERIGWLRRWAEEQEELEAGRQMRDKVDSGRAKEHGADGNVSTHAHESEEE
jgi:hypothetical protein